jgi:toxin ParE1/3/4
VLTLRWGARALEEFDKFTDHIGEHDQLAADKLIERIESCVERLTAFPYMHRAGRVLGTCEAVINANCIVVYRVTEEATEIIRVMHTRQRYP